MIQSAGVCWQTAPWLPNHLSGIGLPQQHRIMGLLRSPHAEGGSDRPQPNLLTLQQIANRTCVMCCVLPIIAVHWSAWCKGDSPLPVWNIKKAEAMPRGSWLRCSDRGATGKLTGTILHGALEAM